MSDRPLLETKRYTKIEILTIIKDHVKEKFLQPKIEEHTGLNKNNNTILSITLEEDDFDNIIAHILYREDGDNK